jgi:hypothetical protein
MKRLPAAFLARTRCSPLCRAFVSTLFGMLLLTGCGHRHEALKPEIRIAQLPPAAVGGPDHLDAIGGTVVNAAPGAQIVLYAHSGDTWWVQPFRNRAFTKVEDNNTWSAITHRGTEYAALLVTAGFQPSGKLAQLPTPAGNVLAVAIARGSSPSPNGPPVLHFSGYEWQVRSGGGDSGGDLCHYDVANARVDQQGYLHLSMGEAGGRWRCAGVHLPRNFGYGTYRVVVEDSTHLPASAVLSILLRSSLEDPDERTGYSMQLGKWGQTQGKNASYVLQPYYIPGNTVRYSVPSGPVTYTLRWSPGKAEFRTFAGNSSSDRPAMMQHVFRSGVPVAGSESVFLDLHNFHHRQSGLSQSTEIVVEKFEYLP